MCGNLNQKIISTKRWHIVYGLTGIFKIFLFNKIMNSIIVTLNCICCTHKGVHTAPVDHNYVQCPPVKYNTYSWGMPTVPVNNLK